MNIIEYNFNYANIFIDAEFNEYDYNRLIPQYHFVTRWHLEHTTCECISKELSDTQKMTQWWPQLYREITILNEGQPGGVGKNVAVKTKGFLPYVLQWTFTVTESREPNGYGIVASGDLIGKGRWDFVQDANDVDVTYDWNVELTKKWLKPFSPILRPLLSANHNYVMMKGEAGLQSILANS